MVSLFKDYIDILLHPINSHEEIANMRERLTHMKKNRVFAIVDDSYRPDTKLTFTNFTLISWTFVIISAFYSLGFMLIGMHLSNSSYFESLNILPGFSNGSTFSRKVFLITILFEVVLFPLAAWFYIKFWRVIISFFGTLFDREVDADSLDIVVNASLVGNSFLLVPVIGKIFKSLSQVYYIFLGIRHNLKFTLTQSLLVVVSPLILIGMFLLFIVMYIMLIINMIQ